MELQPGDHATRVTIAQQQKLRGRLLVSSATANSKHDEDGDGCDGRGSDRPEQDCPPSLDTGRVG